MIEDGENPSVVLRRMQPSRSEVNLPKRITPYHIAYKTSENEGSKIMVRFECKQCFIFYCLYRNKQWI